jgi:hypothetical protein
MAKTEKIQQAFTDVLLGATPEAVIPFFLNSLTVKEQREFEMFMSLSDEDKKAVLNAERLDYQEKLKAETIELLKDLRDKYPNDYSELMRKEMSGNYYELQNQIINEYIKIVQSKISA